MMKTIPALRSAVLAAAVLAAACSPTGTDDLVQDLAFIEMEGQPAQVSVPATARVEEAITVSVKTYGGGCTEMGETQVTVNGSVANVTPLDREPTGDVGCPRIVREFTHEARVTFETPGEAEVRVHGRRMPGGERFTVTRTVTVQPAG